MKEHAYRWIDTFWARDLGLESFQDLSPAHCTVQRSNTGVQMFRRNGRIVVAAPPALVEDIEKAMSGLHPDEIFSVTWLAHALGPLAEKIIGPADVTYADESTFLSMRDDGARQLSESDLQAYAELQAALTVQEQESSGFTAGVFPAFGVFSNGTLCAAANYDVWQPSIAHIRVATHPEHRRLGFAKATIRVLAAHAFQRNLILQWRALSSNTNSLSLARDLGFEPYCTTIYARCREA